MNKENIAIIGSGISGLSASFFLSNKFNVHLFEKEKKLGGHTRTVNVNKFNQSLPIDTGFIVYNYENYPDLVSFFSQLNVATQKSDMSFAVSCTNPNLEYGGTNLNSLFAQRKNIFSFKFISLIFEILRLYKTGKNINLETIADNLTIEDFLSKNKFSKEVRDFHIYPMISSIWSSNIKDVKNFPFISFLHFFNNHGLFNIGKRPNWRFVSGGSYRYVEALINKKKFKFTTNCKIKKIIRKDNKVTLLKDNGKLEVFDKIVFATHADQSLKLLDDPTDLENNILSKFNYTKNKAYLHSDDKLMPNKKLAWSSWNFIQNENLNHNFSLTYWMNRLQKIDCPENYFVSINPHIEPRNIIDYTFFEHPIFNTETLSAQKNLGLIQGSQNTYFCGSYCGYGFHEDGIQSAAYVAKKLDVELPWKRSYDYKSRLIYS